MSLRRSIRALGRKGGLLTPPIRIGWAIGCVILLAIFIWGDWYARSQGLSSFMAPSTHLLWLSVGLGALVGVFTLLVQHIELRLALQDGLKQGVNPPQRQCARYQNLIVGMSWAIAILWIGITIWCLASKIVFLLPFLSGGIVAFIFNNSLVYRFQQLVDGNLLAARRIDR
jgi:hypothetical protein